MLGHRDEQLLQEDFDTMREQIHERIEAFAAKVLHAEEVCGEPGRRVAVVVFVTKPLRGSNPFAVFQQGARWTMMYVQLAEAADGTRVVVAAGGAETMWGTDWGRNESLVARFLRD